MTAPSYTESTDAFSRLGMRNRDAGSNCMVKSIWIIGGGEMQSFAVKKAHEMGFETVVTDADKNCFCSRLATRFFQVSVFDTKSHIRLANELSGCGVKIAAVLASGIDAPFTMASLSKYLGLHGTHPDVARIVSHKGEFRKQLSRTQVPQPRFLEVSAENLTDAIEVLREFEFPVVVKNTDSSGSRGTRLIGGFERSELRHALEAAIEVSRSRVAIAEEAWEGSEHTVEVFIDRKKELHRAFITDRLFDFAGGFPVETGLVSPSQLDRSKQEALFSEAEALASALGIDFGILKLDAIYTKEGPRIIEATVRQAGGFDPQVLVPSATGVDILGNTIRGLIGESLTAYDYTPKWSKVAVSGSPWPEPGIITQMATSSEICQMEGVVGCFVRTNVGEMVEPFIDCTKRVAIVVAVGESLERARKSLDGALLKLEPKISKSVPPEFVEA